MSENEHDTDHAHDAHDGHDGHHGHHGHDGHDHGGRHASGRLGVAAASNVGFAVVQVLVGLAIGSVVVLADAAHQTVDALGLVTALVAVRAARRPAEDAWTYGMGKADALGGFVSGLLLVGSIAWIVVESIGRLARPVDVSGGGVIAIGLIAIAVNGAGVVLVGHSHGDDAMSLRAARLHLLTDLAGSVVVVAAGAALAAGAPSWVDPVSSLVLCIVVLWTTSRLLRATSAVLLDKVPQRLSVPDIERLLRAQDGVGSVHHVHLRALGGGQVSASAHVVVDGERSVHDAQDTVERLSVVLLTDHAVAHTTIQIECHPCSDSTHS